MQSSLFEDLKQKIVNANPEGLKYVFEECGNYCIKTLIKKTNCSYEDAEDILMEAMLSFRNNMIQGKIEYISSLRSYMYTTCWNKWMDLYRGRKRWQKEMDLVEKNYYSVFCESSDPLVKEEEEMSMVETVKKQLEVTQNALKALKENCQKILTYFYIEQRSMDEIAQIMGFASPGVAKVSKHRCYKKLATKVETQFQ
ncbi:MAG: sigma-70 family RNA polymerase sigma factor [Bacteroidetes bacterium]|nr:sigma-70 family RNA polymerase sigma factor [Bacteroidota bacterium]MCB0843263.1 sigma-70 family RNA polymerase sigma factor [Bacteroidota bacterium]